MAVGVRLPTSAITLEAAPATLLQPDPCLQALVSPSGPPTTRTHLHPQLQRLPKPGQLPLHALHVAADAADVAGREDGGQRDQAVLQRGLRWGGHCGQGGARSPWFARQDARCSPLIPHCAATCGPACSDHKRCRLGPLSTRTLHATHATTGLHTPHLDLVHGAQHEHVLGLLVAHNGQFNARPAGHHLGEHLLERRLLWWAMDWARQGERAHRGQDRR